MDKFHTITKDDLEIFQGKKLIYGERGYSQRLYMTLKALRLDVVGCCIEKTPNGIRCFKYSLQ